MATAGLPVPLQFNCGFCRVSINELSSNSKAHCKFHRDHINQVTREEAFRQQFSCMNFDEELFKKPDKLPSLFNRRCNQVMNFFSKKWNPCPSRLEYICLLLPALSGIRFLPKKKRSTLFPNVNDADKSIASFKGVSLERQYLTMTFAQK